MRIALAIVCLLVSGVGAGAQEPPRPLLRMELDKDSAIPGQPLVLRLAVLAPTWFPKAPVFPSFEAPNVMVRLPPRSTQPVSERIGGETWSGVSRSYRLYPMLAGRFEIPVQTVQVTYADPATTKPIVADLATEAVRFTGERPLGSEGHDPFIAAAALTIEQTIEGDPADLEPGGAVVRTIIVTIEGTSPIFVPPLLVGDAAEGLSAYPREPVVTESEERGILSGRRSESVTYVPTTGGRFALPPVSLGWFNLKTGQIETAEIGGLDLAVRGALPRSRAVNETAAVAPSALAAFAVSALLLIVLKRHWPRVTAARRRRREAYQASPGYAFARAQKALRSHSLGRAYRAIDQWFARVPGRRTAEDRAVSRTLLTIGSRLYGNTGRPASEDLWIGAQRRLREARQVRHGGAGDTGGEHALQPLNPRLV